MPGLIHAETERLAIRPFTWDDLPRIEEIHRNGQVTQYLMLSAAWTPEVARMWLGDLLGHYETDGCGHHAVIRKSDRVLIGRTGLSSWLIEGEMELGYTFAQEGWGQGYATEASRVFRNLAFADWGLDRIISLIQKENAGSANVARKHGLVYERDLPRYERTFTIWAQDRAGWEATCAREANAGA